MRALIVEDGLSRQALAATRALAAAGWSVGIGSPLRSGIAAGSRSCAGWHPVASPRTDVERFAGDVERAIAEGGYEVVFGARDDDVAALSFARDRLPATLAHPAPDRIAIAQDKLELARLGAEAGFRVPDDFAVGEAEAALEGGPLVVKPRVGPAVARALEDHGRLPGRPAPATVRSAAELRAAVAAIEAGGDEALVQRWHGGTLAAVVVIAGPDHAVVSSFQQLADLTWPLGAGISVRARVVDPDPRLAGFAASLVRAMRWSGIAQLQMIQPGDGREPVLIDFNGRFYGSLALALAAGSNIADAWGRCVLDGACPDPGPARPGTRYQWAWGDLRRATQERRGGLLRDLAGVARYAAGAAHSVLDLRDPVPALRYLRLAARRSWKRSLR